MTWVGTRRWCPGRYAATRPGRPAYELVLREGGPTDMLDYIDGALLVDIWDDLELPAPIRQAWQPLIRKSLPKRRRE